MQWFFVALIAPFLWSIVNHADKYLLSKYFKRGGVGALMLFSTLFGLVVLPIAFFMASDVLLLDPKSITLLIVASIANALAITLYLRALQEEETSVVVPIFQLVPFFSYILSYFILGEKLELVQMLGGILILFGAIAITIDFKYLASRNFKLKLRLLVSMMASSALFALYVVLFKSVAVEEGYWLSTFWEYVGLVIVGVFIWIFNQKARGEFIATLKSNSAPIIGVNVGSEILTIAGNMITNFAALAIPVTMVLLASAYQPVFVLIQGVLLTLLFPKIAEEDISKTALTIKITAIVIVVIGSYILLQ
jgi:drug/metabolite transporter (DMT)-like permease